MIRGSMTPGSIKPIYVLHGNDAYLRDEHRRALMTEIIGDADPQVCLAAFDATAELAVVLDELRTLPFLAPRRVVIIRDADAFVSAHRDPLERYLESPAESGTLLLQVSAWPSNTRLSKLVAKIGKVVDCNQPDARELPQWITQAAAKRNKKIDREAAELLAVWIGADLAALDSELEKLCLFIGNRPNIVAADIAALVASTAGPGPFDLTNAIIAGNPKAALTALGGMLNKRGEEFRVLGLIASHLRKALLAQQLKQLGQNPESVLPYNMPPMAKKAFLNLLARRPLRKMQMDFRKLIRADLGMKSGTEPLAAMQDLIVALCT